MGARAYLSRPHAMVTVTVYDKRAEAARAHSSTVGAIWRSFVWDVWRGGTMIRLASLLADFSQPARLTVELDPQRVRRLLIGAHLRSHGLRQLLARLVHARLLIVIRRGDGEHWGTYALALPRTSGSEAGRRGRRPALHARQT